MLSCHDPMYDLCSTFQVVEEVKYFGREEGLQDASSQKCELSDRGHRLMARASHDVLKGLIRVRWHMYGNLQEEIGDCVIISLRAGELGKGLESWVPPWACRENWQKVL